MPIQDSTACGAGPTAAAAVRMRQEYSRALVDVCRVRRRVWGGVRKKSNKIKMTRIVFCGLQLEDSVSWRKYMLTTFPTERFVRIFSAPGAGKLEQNPPLLGVMQSVARVSTEESASVRARS